MNRNHLPLWAQILIEDRRPAKHYPADEPLPEDEVINIPSFSPARASTASNSCLVLMAHGSKDARWRGTFECLYASVSARFGGDIRLAYMEFVGPTLMDVAQECHAQGVRHMRVLPLFMAGGAHVATDIPEQMAQIRETFPSMSIEAMAPIGEDPRMFAVIQEIIGDHANASGQRITAA